MNDSSKMDSNVNRKIDIIGVLDKSPGSITSKNSNVNRKIDIVGELDNSPGSITSKNSNFNSDVNCEVNCEVNREIETVGGHDNIPGSIISNITRNITVGGVIGGVIGGVLTGGVGAGLGATVGAGISAYISQPISADITHGTNVVGGSYACASHDGVKFERATEQRKATVRAILSFPHTMQKFKDFEKDYYIIEEHPRSYRFGDGTNKFSICVFTMERLLSSGVLKEVDLSLPENELPDFTGKSRKEILETLANSVGEDHEKLICALRKHDIDHIVIPITKSIYVKNCDWTTLVKISKLVNQLQLDLTVSGGGIGEYYVNTCQSSGTFLGRLTQRFRNGIEFLATLTYQTAITTSCPTSNPVRNSTIGVIDSGCKNYLDIARRRNVIMHHTIIEALNPPNTTNVNYYDSYQTHFGIEKYVGHGTGVVEIIAKGVVSGTKIYVANIGMSYGASNVESAMMKLFKRNVDVINCSFGVPYSQKLARTLKILKTAGIIIIAAAGNRSGSSDPGYVIDLGYIDSALNDGTTIMAGSHNDSDVISEFSIRKCKANICGRGENVYIQNVLPQVRNGTSFSAPHVTAVVSNYLSYSRIKPNQTTVRRYLNDTAGDITCDCIEHHGQKCKLKLDALRIMRNLN